MGAWATIGVLAEKGIPRVSSTGQNFTIWKIASLDSALISVFLFGEAFTHHYKEPAGCIVAIFNAKVRRDDKVGFELGGSCLRDHGHISSLAPIPCFCLRLFLQFKYLHFYFREKS